MSSTAFSVFLSLALVVTRGWVLWGLGWSQSHRTPHARAHGVNPPRTLQPPRINVSHSGPASAKGQKQGSLQIGGWIPSSRRPGELSRRGLHTGRRGCSCAGPLEVSEGTPRSGKRRCGGDLQARAFRPRASSTGLALRPSGQEATLEAPSKPSVPRALPPRSQCREPLGLFQVRIQAGKITPCGSVGPVVPTPLMTSPTRGPGDTLRLDTGA